MMGLYRTYHAQHFLVAPFIFLVHSQFPCGRLISCLSLSFLLHIKYTLSYPTITTFKYTSATIFYSDVVKAKILRLLILMPCIQPRTNLPLRVTCMKFND